MKTSLLVLLVFVSITVPAFAGDALDSILKCANVKGGSKKAPDAKLYTVYIRSVGKDRLNKIDVVGLDATLSFPDLAGRFQLVNSWMDLNEEKALYIDSKSSDDPMLWLEVKQGTISTDPSLLQYTGEIEIKKAINIYDKAIVCQCGNTDSDSSGNPVYASWKAQACTPNDKGGN